jgi:predicted choloylglycine hydrolase
MVAAGTLRVVRAEGDAVDRGRRVGLELGDLVTRSLTFYRGLFEERRLGRAKLDAAGAPYREAAERRFPEYLAWLDALAGAAEAPATELFAVNAYEELEARSERCSSFVVSGEGATLLGHNEMWLAGDAENVAVVVERPSDGVAVASPTIACCLPAVGMNGWGTAQGIDSLAAHDERIGVPRVLVSRHSLDACDRQDAVRRAATADRAGGYAHLFAFRGGDTAVAETSAERHAVLTEPRAHTNHYLDPDLAILADTPSESSAQRYERLSELLDETEPRTPEEAMEVLRREAAAHVDAGADDEASVVVFSLVCDVEAGRMWVAPGTPTTTPYHEVDLEGVVAT